MKLPTFLAILSIAAISQASAATLIDLDSTSFNSNGRTNLGTVTATDVEGYTQLVITYTVTTAAPHATDSWFGVVINPNTTTGGVANSMTRTRDLGALLRTDRSARSHGAYVNGGSDETKPDFEAPAAALDAGSFLASVQLIIDITNGFEGSSTFTFAIDEGSDTFITTDKSITGTMTWNDSDQAVFYGLSYNTANVLSDFTVEAVGAVPEPTTALLAGLGGLCLLRRRRA